MAPPWRVRHRQQGAGRCDESGHGSRCRQPCRSACVRHSERTSPATSRGIDSSARLKEVRAMGLLAVLNLKPTPELVTETERSGGKGGKGDKEDPGTQGGAGRGRARDRKDRRHGQRWRPHHRRRPRQDRRQGRRIRSREGKEHARRDQGEKRLQDGTRRDQEADRRPERQRPARRDHGADQPGHGQAGRGRRARGQARVSAGQRRPRRRRRDLRRRAQARRRLGCLRQAARLVRGDGLGVQGLRHRGGHGSAEHHHRPGRRAGRGHAAEVRRRDRQAADDRRCHPPEDEGPGRRQQGQARRPGGARSEGQDLSLERAHQGALARGDARVVVRQQRMERPAQRLGGGVRRTR